MSAGTAAERDAGRACVVHPFSAGRHLAPVFAGRGYDTVAVIPERPLEITHPELFNPDHYSHVLLDGDDQLAARLRKLDVSIVMPGSEDGVELADMLAGELGIAGNAPQTARVRRDKGLMAEALADAGLGHVRTYRAGSLREAKLARSRLGSQAVVVKPATGAGNDMVRVCASERELEEAWAAAFGQVNCMGERNTHLLVQEFVTGQQYVVNTVSCIRDDGSVFHYVCEVWLDSRTVAAGRPIYDRADLLDGDDPMALAAGEYVCRSLDAVGIVSHDAHSEIILTDSGFALIDLGARLDGGIASPESMKPALGCSQCDLAVDAAIAPEAFARAHQGPYRRRQAYTRLDLVSAGDGTIDAALAGELMNLPTVIAVSPPLKAGGRVTRTEDLKSSPACVSLTGDRSQIDQAVRTIRSFERSGLYQYRLDSLGR